MGEKKMSYGREKKMSYGRQKKMSYGRQKNVICPKLSGEMLEG